MRKRWLKVGVVMMALLSFFLSGCTATGKSSGEYQIGITQMLSHPSLDSAREGFKQALADAGISASFDEQNAQGDQSTITSIANKFSNDKLDLILAISTQSAQTTANLIQDTPILFTAVTDPVLADLVREMDHPGANVTGTTDMNPVAEQISLIKQLAPGAKTVGIVYSSGEINSKIQVDLAKKAAETEGLEVIERTISNAAELSQAAQAIKADALYVPTDNNVVNGMEIMVAKAEADGVPLVCGESDSVNRGCLATYSIDYRKLGYQTGQMAVKILRDGVKPAELPVEAQKEFNLFINKTTAQRSGIIVSPDLLAKAEVIG